MREDRREPVDVYDVQPTRFEIDLPEQAGDVTVVVKNPTGQESTVARVAVGQTSPRARQPSTPTPTAPTQSAGSPATPESGATDRDDG